MRKDFLIICGVLFLIFFALFLYFSPSDSLLDEREGFGRFAQGGKHPYLVTTLNDSGPGSLREALESEDSLWITFNTSGTIFLEDKIRVRSFKTIDGRGQNITITRYGLYLWNVSDIIIENIRFQDIYEDSLRIIYGSHDIWIDHCFFSDSYNGTKTYSPEEYDGLIDITRESTNITISWSRFEDHNKVMLMGHNDTYFQDKEMYVTLHHNYFFNTTQRHPRVSYGKVHLYNNYFHGWHQYAVRSTVSGEIYSDRNAYFSPNQHALTYYHLPQENHIYSSEDLFNLPHPPFSSYEGFVPSEYYYYSPDPIEFVLNNVSSEAGATR